MQGKFSPTDGRKDAGDMVGHFAFGRAENLRGANIIRKFGEPRQALLQK